MKRWPVASAAILCVALVQAGDLGNEQPAQRTRETTEAPLRANLETGHAYFTACSGCHGSKGNGNRLLQTPDLTLLEVDYIVRQLRNFRDGLRGADTDRFGWQMRGVAAALPSDRAMRAVAEYATSQRSVHAGGHHRDESPRSNVARGKALYESCVGCHGLAGEGRADLHAPRLAGQHNEYVERQIVNFRSGLRGTDPRDFEGAGMRAIAKGLPDEASATDLAAYIATF